MFKMPAPLVGRAEIRLLTGVALIGALPLLSGCGSSAEGAVHEEVVQDTQALYQITPYGIWPQRKIPVCYSAVAQGATGFASYYKVIMAELERSWSAVGIVNFSHSYNCPSGSVAKIDTFDENHNNDTHYSITATPGATLNFKPSSLNNRYNHHTVAHEFGHVMGFTHESARTDFTAADGSCSAGASSGGKTYATAANDTASLMTCSTGLSAWDERGIIEAYGRRVQGFYPLTNYLGTGGDYILDVVEQNRTPGTSYTAKYAEGWVYANGASVPGTTGIQIWRNSSNLRAAAVTSSGVAAIKAAGYSTYLGGAGSLYSNQQPGTVALKLYKKSNLYLTTINTPPSGYTLVSTEGYVFQDRPYKVLQRWWTDGTEYETTDEDSDDIINYGVFFDGADSAIMKYNVTGTVSLDTYWSVFYADSYTSTYNYGEDYFLTRHEGYVFTSQVGGTVPLSNFWSNTNSDSLATTRTTVSGDYSKWETVGYAYPLAK